MFLDYNLDLPVKFYYITVIKLGQILILLNNFSR